MIGRNCTWCHPAPHYLPDQSASTSLPKVGADLGAALGRVAGANERVRNRQERQRADDAVRQLRLMRMKRTGPCVQHVHVTVENEPKIEPRAVDMDHDATVVRPPATRPS